MVDRMSEHDSFFDVVILGAGGAGLMCALTAARRGLRVAVVDHSKRVGGKITISGGGRCNFTNLTVGPQNYVSQNPHFATSALRRFQPNDFIAMVEKHGIAYHERRHGQLFCNESAKQLVAMLEHEVRDVGVTLFLEQEILTVERLAPAAEITPTARFKTCTDKGLVLHSTSLVVATGGLSLPKIGATDIGYRIAQQFDVPVTALAPALDGFILSEHDQKLFEGFSGIALDATIRCGAITFQENLLFTHVGLSGPVALQASLHWNPGDSIFINFLPSMTEAELQRWFSDRRDSKTDLKTLVSTLLPKRLAEALCEKYVPRSNRPINVFSTESLTKLQQGIQNFICNPKSTVGYSKAEVTRGGVDTHALSSKTMESKTVPGLYFIGEVVDVTGWLGGFNYQWAWASGHAAGSSV